jgi:hypothetical protein
MVKFTNAIMNILLYNLKLKILKFLLNLITNKILTFLRWVCWSGFVGVGLLEVDLLEWV